MIDETDICSHWRTCRHPHCRQHRVDLNLLASAAKLPWSVGSGRSIRLHGEHQFSIAANAPGYGLDPADLDAMAHRLALMLNDDEAT